MAPALNPLPGTRRRDSVALPVALGFGLWLASSLGGYAALVAYAHVPGAATPTPALRVPGAVPRRPSVPTLVVVFHPECPCSRASLAELARLLARLGDRVTATALFVRPEGEPAGWERGDLWAQAGAVPGLTVLGDPGGATAAELHAWTSGDALLFDAGGALVFRGGLTASRGHEGSAEGQSAILAHVERGAGSARTPVFGCPLFAPDAGSSAGETGP